MILHDTSTLLYSTTTEKKIKEKLAEARPQVTDFKRVFNLYKSESEFLNVIRKEFKANGKSTLYNSLKEFLPIFLPYVKELVNDSLTNSVANIKELSDVIYLEVDLFEKSKFEQAPDKQKYLQRIIELTPIIKAEVCKSDYVYACWISTSNAGLGLLVKTKNLTKRNFTEEYLNIARIINEQVGLTKNYGLNFGMEVMNLHQPCIISYDPNIYINNNSWVRSITPDVIDQQQPKLKPVEENKFKKPYYSQTNLDAHYQDLMEVVNDKLIYQGNGCWFAPQGLKFIRLFGRKRKVKIGERNKTLHFDLSVYLYLNRNFSRQNLFKWLNTRNELLCERPLKESEIHNIISNVLKSIDFNKLPFTLKYTWYDSTCKLTKEQKISHSNKNRKLINLNKLNKLVEDEPILNNIQLSKKLNFHINTITNLKGVTNSQSTPIYKKEEAYIGLKCEEVTPLKTSPKDQILKVVIDLLLINKPIYRNTVIELTGYGEATVKKYWKSLKSEIENHNKHIKEMEIKKRKNSYPNIKLTLNLDLLDQYYVWGTASSYQKKSTHPAWVNNDIALKKVS